MKGRGGYEETVHAADQNALNRVYGYGANIMNPQCPKCNKIMDVRVVRGKI
jgi:hypothetical protein